MIRTFVVRLGAFLRDWRSARLRWLHNTVLFSLSVLLLTFFLHFRDVRVEHLELGSIAKKYVLAQVPFDFLDLETTRILREESLKDIGLIYYFDDEEISKAESQIRDELMHDREWRKEFGSLTFDDLTRANDAIRDTLLSVEFTDQRTIQKLAYFGMNPVKFLPYGVGGDIVEPTEEIWEQIEHEAFAGQQTEASRLLLDRYRSFPWSLKEDFNLRQAVRLQIKDKTPIKRTHVEAGTRIINAGDKVTRRHLNMLQEMKSVLTEEKHLLKPLTIFGSVVFSTILILVALCYFYKFHYSILISFSKMSLIAVVVLLTLGIAKLTTYFILQQPNYVEDVCRFPIYLLFTSIVLSILIDRSVAIVVSGFVVMMLDITLARGSYDFLIMNLLTAVMGIIWTQGVRKRKEIFSICAKVWLFSIPMVLAFNLIENQFWNRQVLTDCITTGLYILGIAILTVAVLPLLESTFAIVTGMTLLEVADSNHPLLRRLSLEASGTYQHSLGVASLAEEAALAIGANALLCRASALFHDIGKLIQPNYFTENLRDGFNMHQLLTPLESAQVIIQHVTEGIKLAQHARLPKPIIDIIREHHGTTLVYYFYHAQIEQSGAKNLGIEEGFFRYPGPTPQSRESAIVMLADSIEATFRCHNVLDERSISDLIEGIVVDKIREHQLNASGLTFDDLEALKRAIFRSLLALSHTRPTYPTKAAAEVYREPTLI